MLMLRRLLPGPRSGRGAVPWLSCAYHTHPGVYGNHPLETNLPPADSPSLHTAPPELQLLIEKYRTYGHLLSSSVNTLPDESIPPPRSLDLSRYHVEPESEYEVAGLLAAGQTSMTGEKIADFLNRTYCSDCTLEASYVEDEIERDWIFREFEEMRESELSGSTKGEIAQVLMECETFDKFVSAKFPTVKRYSGEGAESMLVFTHALLAACPDNNLSNIVFGIAHRGRLNLLSQLGYPAALMFRKMAGLFEFPERVAGEICGDVLSHLFTTTDLPSGTRVTLLPNPSHLEAINGACLGKVRSQQSMLQSGCYGVGRKGDAACVLIHGDGAFSGQGVVAECFNMAYTPHFNVGGTIHFVTNNQLGYTMQKGRSSRYVSDMAKIINCPVVHVSVDNPEAVHKVAQLCVRYRNTFHKDILVDMLCYRKWGHNELDDPTLTQPVMYNIINSRTAVPDLYCKRLEDESLSSEVEKARGASEQYRKKLDSDYKSYQNYQPVITSFKDSWREFSLAPPLISTWNTGVNSEMLRFVGSKSVQFPDWLNVHEKLRKTLSARVTSLETEGAPIDWATAEALAVGSLLMQGHNVRISGQDVGRGTFSHRHMQIVDQKTDKVYVPLNHLFDPSDQSHDARNAGRLELANCILSEEAVLGFEYGFSLDNPRTLVVWEAQFGDFFNGAQIIIDTLIASGESKWMLQSGLVMLLPHGIDGMGPEHSSCRLERFLQLTDSSETSIDSDQVNMVVANPTTPAQYFHLLREQQVRKFRKPLVVASPKKLLRDPAATSTLDHFSGSTHFLPVIDDNSVQADQVKRVMFCSGKVYYTLLEEVRRTKRHDIALVRVERLCPFPAKEIMDVTAKFDHCEDFVWCQEECRNSGAWSFVQPRFRNLAGIDLRYVGRKAYPVPATGNAQVFKRENEALLRDALA